MRIFILLFLFALTSCEEAENPKQAEEKPPELVLSAVSFVDLPGWNTDNFKSFIPAFGKSCERILRPPPDKEFGSLKQAGTYSDWQPLCEKFLKIKNASTEISPKKIRAFFENNFTPHKVSADNEDRGLFTGYYEASLRGSRTHKPPYIYPLHSRPDDLVMVQLGAFRAELKGQRIAGRITGGNLVPYENREDIVNGNWPHDDKVLLWVDDPVDAFFVQIQGSGLVKMDDGSMMRIGYAGQNGHPYYAIGRELIKREALTKKNVSMQSIRNWLATNPEDSEEIMNTNKSYVFFREIIGEGPIGGEGIAITAGRSLAIDRSLISYGMPIWVDIAAPVEDTREIQRMMVTQDTGGAIRGPVRGDVFWGYGKIAEEMAGQMKSSGRYWVLLPNIINLQTDL